MRKIIVFVLFCLVFQSFVFAEDTVPKSDFITPILKGQVVKDKIEKKAGSMPLVIAIVENDKELFDKLIKSKMYDVNARYLRIPITFIALCYDRNDMLNILLDNGADPSYKYINYSLMYYAVVKGNLSAVKILRSHDAEIDDATLKFVKKSKDKELIDFIDTVL